MPTCSDPRLVSEQLPRFEEQLRRRGEPAHRRWSRMGAARSFLAHRPEMPAEARLQSWIQELAVQARSADKATEKIRALLPFLEFCGVDVLQEKLAPLSACIHLVRGLAGGEDWSVAYQGALKPAFRSELGGWLEAFLAHREGRKLKLRGWRSELLRLDRLAVSAGVQCFEDLTPGLLQRYLSEHAPSPGTRGYRLCILRVLRRFLEPRGARLFLPDGLSGPSVYFRPHIFSLREMGLILETMRQRGERRHSFRWLGLETIIFLCYACGLRLNEPLALQMRDVDFRDATLLVHRTKFYKQRWVPLGKGALRRLEAYRQAREESLPDHQAPDTLFFLNERGIRFERGMVRRAFTSALVELKVPCRGTCPRPRLHDLRHSLAVHRLYQWYAEGADVQNKLPLLSTFLGHNRYHYTETYLHLTEDLIRQAGRNFQRSFESVVGQVVP